MNRRPEDDQRERDEIERTRAAYDAREMTDDERHEAETFEQNMIDAGWWARRRAE